MKDKLNASDSLLRGCGLHEKAEAHGRFVVRCFNKFKQLVWDDTFENIVMTEGKNLMLDTLFAGAGYSVAGPYMGLISSVGFTAIAASDTMAQVNGTNGWKEAGSGANFPLYTAPRKTCVWSAAAAGVKALSATLTFLITTGGTVKGAFIVLGVGAEPTIASANGKLWSAGLSSGGDRGVFPGDAIVVLAYATSL